MQGFLVTLAIGIVSLLLASSAGGVLLWLAIMAIIFALAAQVVRK